MLIMMTTRDDDDDDDDDDNDDDDGYKQSRATQKLSESLQNVLTKAEVFVFLYFFLYLVIANTYY